MAKDLGHQVRARVRARVRVRVGVRVRVMVMVKPWPVPGQNASLYFRGIVRCTLTLP